MYQPYIDKVELSEKKPHAHQRKMSSSYEKHNIKTRQIEQNPNPINYPMTKQTLLFIITIMITYLLL